MVTVLNYDEVCERLKALHLMLKEPPQSADDVDGPTVECT
jgi:hypothetical protein